MAVIALESPIHERSVSLRRRSCSLTADFVLNGNIFDLRNFNIPAIDAPAAACGHEQFQTSQLLWILCREPGNYSSLRYLNQEANCPPAV